MAKFRLRGFEESVIFLKRWQRQASQIRKEGACHCPRRAVLLSYLVPIQNADNPVVALGIQNEEAKGNQLCGYYCASCGWGNAGSRRIKLLGEVS